MYLPTPSNPTRVACCGPTVRCRRAYGKGRLRGRCRRHAVWVCTSFCLVRSFGFVLARFIVTPSPLPFVWLSSACCCAVRFVRISQQHCGILFWLRIRRQSPRAISPSALTLLAFTAPSNSQLPSHWWRRGVQSTTKGLQWTKRKKKKKPWGCSERKKAG